MTAVDSNDRSCQQHTTQGTMESSGKTHGNARASRSPKSGMPLGQRRDLSTGVSAYEAGVVSAFPPFTDVHKSNNGAYRAFSVSIPPPPRPAQSVVRPTRSSHRGEQQNTLGPQGERGIKRTEKKKFQYLSYLRGGRAGGGYSAANSLC